MIATGNLETTDMSSAELNALRCQRSVEPELAFGQLNLDADPGISFTPLPADGCPTKPETDRVLRDVVENEVLPLEFGARSVLARE
jgi:hypothetical protein